MIATMKAGQQALGRVHYPRHFSMLGGIVALLAATEGLHPAIGIPASFGLYGALYCSVTALSMPASDGRWRKPCFVALGASLCALNAALGVYAGRFIGGLPAMVGPALLLALASGFGAAGTGMLIRRLLEADLPLRALLAITLGCIVATLAVLASGIYRHAPGFTFAASWWLAFSMGLWLHDGRRAARAT